jgi:phosphohistidine phosphatase
VARIATGVHEKMTHMSRRLVLLRHAKSAWPGDLADHERPLAGRGRREAPLAGRWLAEQVGDIDLVVCSSALRTRQTWELVSAELGSETGAAPEVRLDERIYEATAGGLFRLARELPDTARTVLFVGHNPGLEDLVGALTGDWPTMLTSTIAVLSVPGDWAALTEGQARLDALEVARG